MNPKFVDISFNESKIGIIMTLSDLLAVIDAMHYAISKSDPQPKNWERLCNALIEAKA